MRSLRTLAISAILHIVSTMLPAQAPAPPDSPAARLNGEWNGTLKLDNSSPRVSLVFHVTDSTFAGEVFADGDRMGPMEDGSFKGDKVHFKVGQFDFTGSIRGTSMTVDLVVYNGSIKTMTLKKAPDSLATPARPAMDIARASRSSLSLAHPVLSVHFIERRDAPPNLHCRCFVRRVAVGAGLAAGF